jgi:hypothetical protein
VIRFCFCCGTWAPPGAPLDLLRTGCAIVLGLEGKSCWRAWLILQLTNQLTIKVARSRFSVAPRSSATIPVIARLQSMQPAQPLSHSLRDAQFAVSSRTGQIAESRPNFAFSPPWNARHTSR